MAEQDAIAKDANKIDDPFAAIVAEDKMPTGAPSFGERIKLNAADSFYRGSALGAAALLGLKRAAESNAYPTAAFEYDKALYDLGRYDNTPSWSGPLEGAVALAGQFAGGMLSPEAWIMRVPGVNKVVQPMMGRFAGTAIERTAEAAASQGAIQLATDPVVQALNITSGQQQHYEPVRTALSPLFGAALGGSIHGATEFGRAAIGALRDVRAERAARGAEGAEPGKAPEPPVEVPNPGVPLENERAVATRRVQTILAEEKAKLSEQDPDLKSPVDEPVRLPPEGDAELRPTTGETLPESRAPEPRPSEATGAEPPVATARTSEPKSDIQTLLDRVAEDERLATMLPAAPRDPNALQFREMATEGGVNIPVRPAPPTGEPGPVLSPQQQVRQVADDLAATVRTGRVQNSKAGGQYDPTQDVARIRNAADIEVASHEVAHALEKRFGQELTDLINAHAHELAPMDYDPSKQRPFEGFAEYVKFMIANPSHASASAPQFESAFRQFLAANGPETMKALERAKKTLSDYHAAPAAQQIGSMVHGTEPETLVRNIRKDGLPATISLVLGRAYEAMFDDKTAIVRAVRELARMVRDREGALPTLEGSDNPETMFRMFKVAHQAAIGDMRDGIRIRGQETGVSLRDALIAATGEPGAFGHWDTPKMKDFNAYVAALAADWRYEKFLATGRGRRPIAMDREQLQKGIAEFEAANPGFRRGADLLHQYSSTMLDKLYSYGMIGAELHGTLKAEKFYVPLFRDLSEKPLWAGEPTSGVQRSDGPGNAQLVRRQEGSDRDIISPMESLVTMTFLANRTILHNEAILSLKRLASRAKAAGATGPGRIFEEIPAHDVVPTSFNLLDAVNNAAKEHGMDAADVQVLSSIITDAFGGKDPIMASVFKHQPTGKRGEPIVFYREGGDLRAGRVISEAEGVGLYEAITALPSELQDAAIRFTSATSGILRAGIVTNPVFAFTNFIRDQMAVAILRPNYLPFNPVGIASEVKQNEFARAYAYYGGVSPGAGAAGLSELMNGHIDQLARKGWAIQKVGALRDVFREGEVLGGLRAMGEVIGVAESGTRLNVFKQVYQQKIKQGASVYDAQIEAARQASDILDFNRHGSRTEAIRALVPFLNAHIQALDKARRTIIEPVTRKIMGDIVTTAEEEAFKNAGLTLAKMLGVGGALGYAYGQLMADHPAYQDANADLRATHLVIPGSALGMPGKLVTIPKPFELAIGFNLGELTGLGVATGDPRMAEFAAKGVYEVITPPNLMESIPLVKTWSELALNRSFFTKRDIVPERMQGRVPSEQFIPGKTSSVARTLGDAIGVSPIKVDYAIGALFGLWGRDLMAASNVADPNAAAAPFESQMFIRRFVKSTGFSEMTHKFWEYAAQKNGVFARAANTYMDMLQVQHRDQDAMIFLNALSEPQRTFVTLKESASEDDSSKPAFSPEMRALHPLIRAHNAVTVSSTYARELMQNAQRQIETGERVDMDPVLRKQVIENLQVLSEMEQMNALIAMGEPGFKGRKPMSTQDQFDTLMTLHPPAAMELATRYATAKIPEQAASERAWGGMRQALIRDGGRADLREFVFDAHSAGYQFGFERTTGRPPRRRLPIEAPAAQPGAP